MSRMKKVHKGELFKAVIALLQCGHSVAISDTKAAGCDPSQRDLREEFTVPSFTGSLVHPYRMNEELKILLDFQRSKVHIVQLYTYTGSSSKPLTSKDAFPHY